jgi:NAD(P)-dependent dehydrogenase (short-subunit alcohol dehydrogenase family)
MNNIKNKVIAVTGGNGLLGKELIDYLHKVEALPINLEIGVESNPNLNLYHCDVTNKRSVENAISAIFNKYGRIDGWVNNAYPRTDDWANKFENISVESWAKNVDLQLNSVFICCQCVLSLMSRQGNGSIVNMSSIYGVLGPDFSVYNNTSMTMPAAYSAIKGGVINLTRYLASYYGPKGIRINSVSPGGIFNDQDQNFVKNYSNKVPMRRMGLPKDIAPSIAFLLSDDANYITGHNLMVDGGWSCI